MKFRVDTRFNQDKIEQDFIFDDGVRLKKLTREVFDLKEKGVRDALIKLGWTPPDENKHKATER